ncbi:hypothetical protein GH733_008608 [Mirounga leonina]|nr:hypothetical protein GH733_008608 [Mirounga leonina]
MCALPLATPTAEEARLLFHRGSDVTTQTRASCIKVPSHQRWEKGMDSWILELVGLKLSTLDHWVEIACSWCQTGLQQPICNRQPDPSALLSCIIYGPWRLQATLHCITQPTAVAGTVSGEWSSISHECLLHCNTKPLEMVVSCILYPFFKSLTAHGNTCHPKQLSQSINELTSARSHQQLLKSAAGRSSLTNEEIHTRTESNIFLSKAFRDFSLSCQVQKTQSWKRSDRNFPKQISMLKEEDVNGSKNFPLLEHISQQRLKASIYSSVILHEEKLWCNICFLTGSSLETQMSASNNLGVPLEILKGPCNRIKVLTGHKNMALISYMESAFLKLRQLPPPTVPLPGLREDLKDSNPATPRLTCRAYGYHESTLKHSEKMSNGRDAFEKAREKERQGKEDISLEEIQKKLKAAEEKYKSHKAEVLKQLAEKQEHEKEMLQKATKEPPQ